jgi:hypothetical protein
MLERGGDRIYLGIPLMKITILGEGEGGTYFQIYM